MNADLGTLACLVKSGEELRQTIGNCIGNPTAFEVKWRLMPISERGRFLQALDSLMINTKILSQTNVELIGR